MNKAMFSGVAGLKAHQSKMDVIGNNIANVNTYGYKAQRAVFSDVYYQTIIGASEGSESRGGTNPSSIGYGSSLASIQSQMTTSSVQNTGFGMDVAITGEGFLQVMDASGNTYYTKAGMLSYDAQGYLTDINGNFILGTTDKDGDPGIEKIKLDNIGSVDERVAEAIVEIGGVEYTMSASNPTKFGNVGMTIGSSESLPMGLKAKATISTTGSITVQLNAFESFSNMSELNTAINDAITEANGGEEHAGGTFTLSTDENVFGTDAVTGGFTGAPIVRESALTVSNPNEFFGGVLTLNGFTPTAGTDGFDGEAANFTVTNTGGNYTIQTIIDGVTYSAAVPTTLPQGSAVSLTSQAPADTNGVIEMTLNQTGANLQSALDAGQGTATVSAQAPFLGGVSVTSVSENFPQGANMNFSNPTFDAGTNMYQYSIQVGLDTYVGSVSSAGGPTVLSVAGDTLGEKGTITLDVPPVSTIAQNLGVDLTQPSFWTALSATLSSHSYKTVAATAAVSQSLTGEQIVGSAGGINKGEFTLPNDTFKLFGGAIKLEEPSSDFTGEGSFSTNSDFSVTYVQADPADIAQWRFDLMINGKTYTGSIEDNTQASSSLLLKSAEGDYIEVATQGFEAISQYYKAQNGNADPADGDSVASTTTADSIGVTPSTPSPNLGLGTTSFSLKDGTEGGVITLEELSNITIGADGTVTVSHPEKGLVVAGKISLANFSNPSGLELIGNNYYAQTANSGEPTLADPGYDGTGSLKGSALEMSNVDISEQFAEMITTQRGFQANSRIITVTDTMLEELINLKR